MRAMPAGLRRRDAVAALLIGAAGLALFLVDGKLLGALLSLLFLAQGAAHLRSRG